MVGPTSLCLRHSLLLRTCRPNVYLLRSSTAVQISKASSSTSALSKCHSSQSKTKRRISFPTSLSNLNCYSTAHINENDAKVKRLFDGLLASKRASLAEAITLVESVHPIKKAQAQVLLGKVLEHMKQKKLHSQSRPVTFRIGLSGPPGAGKSTFIETFGSFLTSQGLRVAVLAVDPSSSTTGGKIVNRQSSANFILFTNWR